MSSNIVNNQIRSYTFTPEVLNLGATTQDTVLEFETIKPCKMIRFGLTSLTTVPANDPLTTPIAQVGITINQNLPIVPPMTQADYIAVVQNPELREANIINNGLFLCKLFNPALPSGTKVRIDLRLNTLTLATTTAPAGSCQARCRAIVYDSDIPSGKILRFYSRITPFPQPAGIVANTSIDYQLGVQARVMKWLHLIEESPAATPTDNFTELIEILADGNQVLQSNEVLAKQDYQIITDQALAAAPVGHKVVKAIGSGYNTANQKQITLRITPHTTSATAQYRGYEIYERNY